MNLINMIDKIEDECLTQESFVLSRVCDVYLKASTLLESYEGDDLSAFEVFQEQTIREDMKEQSKGMNIIMKFLTLIPRLIKAIINKIKSKKSASNNITQQQKTAADNTVKRIMKSAAKTGISGISSALNVFIFAISLGAITTVSTIGISKLRKKIKDIKKNKNDKNYRNEFKKYIDEGVNEIIEGLKSKGVNVNNCNFKIDEKLYDHDEWIDIVSDIIDNGANTYDDDEAIQFLLILLALLYDVNSSNYDEYSKNNFSLIFNTVEKCEMIFLPIASNLISKDNKVKQFVDIFEFLATTDRVILDEFNDSINLFKDRYNDKNKYIFDDDYGNYDEFKKTIQEKIYEKNIIAKTILTYKNMIDSIGFINSKEGNNIISKDSDLMKKLSNEPVNYLTRINNEISEYKSNINYVRNILKQAIDSEKSLDNYRKKFPTSYNIFKEIYTMAVTDV